MLNQSQNVSGSSTRWPGLEHQSEGHVLLSIFLLGIVANVAALVATVKLIKSQKVGVNCLGSALIVTDLCGIITISFPTLLHYWKKEWMGADDLCNFQGVLSICCTLASGCLATAMASDRHIAIGKPLFYREYFTLKQAKVSVAYAWVLCLIVSLLPMFGVGKITRNSTHSYCMVDWFATVTRHRVYAIFFAIFGFMLVAVVVIMNAKIAADVYAKKRQVPRITQSRRAEKQDKQIARTSIAISILFPILWLPLMIRIICNQAGTWKDPSLDLWAWLLIILSLAINPFLYCFTRRQCRNVIMRWVICWIPRHHNESVRSRLDLQKLRSLSDTTVTSTGSSDVGSTHPHVFNRTFTNSIACTTSFGMPNLNTMINMQPVSREECGETSTDLDDKPESGGVANVYV